MYFHFIDDLVVPIILYEGLQIRVVMLYYRIR